MHLALIHNVKRKERQTKEPLAFSSDTRCEKKEKTNEGNPLHLALIHNVKRKKRQTKEPLAFISDTRCEKKGKTNEGTPCI